MYRPGAGSTTSVLLPSDENRERAWSIVPAEVPVQRTISTAPGACVNIVIRTPATVESPAASCTESAPSGSKRIVKSASSVVAAERSVPDEVSGITWNAMPWAVSSGVSEPAASAWSMIATRPGHADLAPELPSILYLSSRSRTGDVSAFVLQAAGARRIKRERAGARSNRDSRPPVRASSFPSAARGRWAPSPDRRNCPRR